MRVAAVICEFNPFHNGHKYLIDKIKSECADCVIAIMSGSFVQRGDVAITDKYSRARAALENGCDLVVELPTVFALSSAENFAKGGVGIAKALKADMLCFGAEDDNISMLSDIADSFCDEMFKNVLRKHISNGSYYAKAVSDSIEEVLSPQHCEMLSKPNNTLAVEYIKALKGTDITPIAIKRNGAFHDSDIVSKNIASATHIRNLVQNDGTYDSFTSMNIKSISDIKKLETTILYKLRTMSKEELENLPDVTEGLHNRIFECCRNSNSLVELYNNLKTKRYTMSRLRRIAMCALLDITKSDMQNKAKYIRVLGMNDNGTKLISRATLPLVCRVASDYNTLDKDGKRIFDIDIKASEVFALSSRNNGAYENEFSAQIIKI